MKVKSDHRSKFSNLSNWKEAWKNQGFNGYKYELFHYFGYKYELFHYFGYKYELFHIYFTPFHCTGRYELNKLTQETMIQRKNQNKHIEDNFPT